MSEGKCEPNLEGWKKLAERTMGTDHTEKRTKQAAFEGYRVGRLWGWGQVWRSGLGGEVEEMTDETLTTGWNHEMILGNFNSMMMIN